MFTTATVSELDRDAEIAWINESWRRSIEGYERQIKELHTLLDESAKTINKQVEELAKLQKALYEYRNTV